MGYQKVTDRTGRDLYERWLKDIYGKARGMGQK
jgi:hypothetical protein